MKTDLKVLPLDATMRTLKLSTGTGRKSSKVRGWPVKWAAVVERLSEPLRTKETEAEYRRMSKADRDNVKDVGFFIGGAFSGTRRNNMEIKGRDLLTIDLDHGGPDLDMDLELALEDTEYVLYSTHSHTEEKPRYRLVLPLTRAVGSEEYEPIMRRIAAAVGIENVDRTTYEVSRIMYWPSCCSDAEYVFKHNSGAWVNPDEVLATYGNWKDCAEWPVGKLEQGVRLAATEKAEDPTSKKYPVGTFCRAYSVEDAIETFIADAYSSTDSSTGRYSYTQGTTANGAVVYDNKFMFSHHESDPCYGKLVNAFDLVRIHKFGHLDGDNKASTGKSAAEDDEGHTRLKSYKAMVELITEDRECIRERLRETTQAFSDIEDSEIDADDEDDTSRSGSENENGGENRSQKPKKKRSGKNDSSTDWMLDLSMTKDGQIKPTLTNVVSIISNDDRLTGRIKMNAFAKRLVYTFDLDLGQDAFRRCEDSVNGSDIGDALVVIIRHYVETKYGVQVSSSMAYDAIVHVAEMQQFNPVQDYLSSVAQEWDGVERISEFFVKYVGAEDSRYCREVSRKMFIGAATRAMKPGCKFDHMVVLEGVQGIGKSRLLRSLAVNNEWFSDSVNTFHGKEAVESIQGRWICEISELQAFGKSEIEQTKAFISKQEDRVRMAYARSSETYKRSCIFVGTTNDEEYLRDETGNRRFWPIACGEGEIVENDIRAVKNQLWAEAMVAYQKGESVYLEGKELNEEAMEQQNTRLDQDPLVGRLEKWLDQPVRADRYSDEQDIDFDGDAELVERDVVCIDEICDLMLDDPNASRATQGRVRRALKQIKSWEKATTNKSQMRLGKYGRQVAYMRK